MSELRDVVIVSAIRTPVGAFQGALSSIAAHKLGAITIKAVLEETNVDPGSVDEVIMGNVLSAGQGQAPARQAALGAGLPDSVECLTINKMCGSGLKAVMLGTQAIQTGDAEIVIAGGMENMTQAPYLLPKGRDGHRLGHGQVIDSMIIDGLWDAYNDKHMGNCAELCASEKKYSREAQDEFAKTSYSRAQAAQENGSFSDEIVPVTVPQRKGDPLVVEKDEEPGRANFEKMVKLRPAFEKEGTITAANASKINDGAAAIMLMSGKTARALGLTPLATIVAQASAAHEPEWFTTAPMKAISKVLEKAGLTAQEIDLWEVNEAFAPVAMAPIDEFKLDREKVNVNGGAIAIGHPIGGSGARIFTTLIHAMRNRNVHTGLATLCIGGGEASALVITR
ncbi:MAG: acetyl-CoA C-acetyltransferase [Candidatus Marinimicrobia bacterium]|jgi:acetyl-CoA C-acetyltransferase|nr:acetyl-CoA C-acetyltransferase [Candidatus Neomarinimicrobiota bacterium]MBT3677022.1 acetyl-CoA C-acetyltransferase [Candidatus Neomarinimicrobiota bacterium]MBT3762598.1 acetyl-CoA C-acetyltransferase [Candidatus Neomarinimicrobiota bacterium]MBT4067375.1 acetyl-CoA C-acetyltransferase [Candidatus Neomarinimicrobiota bacterium]MBT4271399.1 acetyl-CoA C-acetyltransferase [Candidatus Neomarinimicrobiota bacterium]